MDRRKTKNSAEERLRIQETALSNLADMMQKREREFDEKMKDIQTEIKALKLFLARTMPEFKKQFPEIQRKLQ